MTFTMVLFGNGKTTIFNTNCRNSTLLLAIKQTCSEVCTIADQLDLADESGECKCLLRNPEGYASEVIAPREKVVLIRAEMAPPASDGTIAVRYFPLLTSAREDKHFMNTLNAAAKGLKAKGWGASTSNRSGSSLSSSGNSSLLVGLLKPTAGGVKSNSPNMLAVPSSPGRTGASSPQPTAKRRTTKAD